MYMITVTADSLNLYLIPLLDTQCNIFDGLSNRF